MTRSLVTGGAGFLGSHLVDALVDRGDEVAALDNLVTGKREKLHPDARLIEADVLDVDRVRGETEDFRPDFVFHLAAQADPKRAFTDPGFDAEVNVKGTINVALAALECGARKLVFTSTGGAMYGSPDPSILPVDESFAVAPASPYGMSKYCAELYLGMLGMQRGLEYSILRPANVYGPRQEPESEVGVVLIFLEQMLAGVTPTMRGFGKATRDYVFVGDVVQALVLASERGRAKPYHVGSGVEVDVETIFEGLQRRLDTSFVPERVPLAPGEVERMALDASLAAKELGWRPKYSLNEGLDKTVEHLESGRR
ncbi:MAG: NAD-dependent epimerase/dehydratase family protein [Chloroflexi bacterium]|nr:NAD-dependent epimerase/dehydratase family protein [Chloroflexota bacterium]MCY3937373.1 NAD-dependent epimerase/dehydratase family protein [Chloroflexota bacterium]